MLGFANGVHNTFYGCKERREGLDYIITPKKWICSRSLLRFHYQTCCNRYGPQNASGILQMQISEAD